MVRNLEVVALGKHPRRATETQRNGRVSMGRDGIVNDE